MTDERRRCERLPVAIPTRIDTPSFQGRIGVTRNVSRTGMLIGTPSRFRIGERATLELRVGEGDSARSIEQSGRIVRLEMNGRDETGIWSYLMAVRFSDPLPDDVLAHVQSISR